MRKNARNVIAAFLAGTPCREATISTDGVTVWSYAMPIARRVTFESGLVAYYVIRRDASPSRTTSSHIDACGRLIPGAEVVAAVSPDRVELRF